MVYNIDSDPESANWLKKSKPKKQPDSETEQDKLAKKNNVDKIANILRGKNKKG